MQNQDQLQYLESVLAKLTPPVFTTQMPVGEHRLWRTLDRYTWVGIPEICDRQNVWVTARDNTGHNTKDTHPVRENKLKFLTPPGMEPWLLRCFITIYPIQGENYLNRQTKGGCMGHKNK